MLFYLVCCVWFIVLNVLFVVALFGLFVFDSAYVCGVLFVLVDLLCVLVCLLMCLMVFG